MQMKTSPGDDYEEFVDVLFESDFPVADLRMLGAKSTCKDRWRQVLAEAGKIDRKHLLTLEAGISEAQTAEMKAYIPARIGRGFTTILLRIYNWSYRLPFSQAIPETSKAGLCHWERSLKRLKVFSD